MERSLDGRGVWERMDTCICTADYLCCLPETIKPLLISYTIIENQKLKPYQKVLLPHTSHSYPPSINNQLF